MAKLETDTNLQQADDFLAQLNQQYTELSPEQCRDFTARLVLLLSNHIGDQAVLMEAMKIARQQIQTA